MRTKKIIFILLLSIIGLLSLIIGGGVVYLRFFVHKVQTVPTSSKDRGLVDWKSIPILGEREDVRLFFANTDSSALVEERTKIPKRENRVERVRELVKVLSNGPSDKGIPTLPPATTLKNVFIYGHTVSLNFNGKGIVGGHPGGSASEILTIYSIVNSIAYNFKDIRDVRILVNNEEIETLAGHIDTRGALKPDWGLVERIQSRK